MRQQLPAADRIDAAVTMLVATARRHRLCLSVALAGSQRVQCESGPRQRDGSLITVEPDVLHRGGRER